MGRWGRALIVILFVTILYVPGDISGETDTDSIGHFSRLYAKRRTLNTRKVQDLSAHAFGAELCQWP